MTERDLVEARGALGAAESRMRRNSDNVGAKAWTEIGLAWVRIHEASQTPDHENGGA